MSRDKDPTLEKEKDYSRQSRSSTGESRHAERKNRRKRRARTHRTQRHAVRQVLGRTRRTIIQDENDADQLADGVAEIRLPYFVIWSPMRLGEYVRNRRRYRAGEAGRRFFRESYVTERHREPFCRFFEAVVQGGVAPSAELAEEFAWILDRRVHGRDREFLTAFFADEPAWRERLEQWIENALRPQKTRRTEGAIT